MAVTYSLRRLSMNLRMRIFREISASREILPAILSTTFDDTINFSGNGNPWYRRSLYNPNPYLEAYFFDPDWNRMEAKRNEGGDSAAVPAVPDAIARKIRHAENFSIRASLDRERVSFEVIIKSKMKITFQEFKEKKQYIVLNFEKCRVQN